MHCFLTARLKRLAGSVCLGLMAFAGPFGSTARAQNPPPLIIKEPSLAMLDSISRAQVGPHARVYHRAAQLGDWPTAITALHYLLDEDPDNLIYQDSLAGMYFRIGNDPALLRLGQEILAARPQDHYVRLLVATSHERQGSLPEALGHFEMLRDGTDEPWFTYKVATLQFLLERVGECRASLQQLLQDPAAEAARIRVATDGVEQEVTLQAAAYNLLGNLELDFGSREAAVAAFEQALHLEPEWALARNNLERARKPKKRR